jgi:chemotaxis protein methyltransferase CheR
VDFLRWALPQLGLRWPGFRMVRRQVCRRIAARVRELGLTGLEEYHDLLLGQVEEWTLLDSLCRVTISRFARDRQVFATLEQSVLPELARHARDRGDDALSAWSAGCASGEEPYTLVLAWDALGPRRVHGLALDVVATDVDERVLARARRACYEPSSLRTLDPDRIATGFVQQDGQWCLRRELAERVTFATHDVRSGPPDGPFDLVLCRNLAFTYFAEALQEQTCRVLARSLRPGGGLVIGAHESLPPACAAFDAWPGARCVHRRR